MKSALAIFISALCLTFLTWIYQSIVPVDEPNTYQKVILASEKEISEDLHLELTHRYGAEFSSIIISKPIEKGSSASYFILLIFILPLSAISILFYIVTLRIIRKTEPAGVVNDGAAPHRD